MEAPVPSRPFRIFINSLPAEPESRRGDAVDESRRR